MTAPDTDGAAPSGIDPRTLGQRLRDGRLERNLTIADIATTIRAPNGLVEAIERDDFDRLGADIYIRGYLTSYAQRVEVPESAVAEVLDRRRDEPVPLQSSAQISHARYLLDRYARKGAYVVLTASIVLPMLWFKDQLQLQGVDLRSLDAPVATALHEIEIAGDEPDSDLRRADLRGTEAVPAVEPGPADDGDLTVVASLAPFYSSRDDIAADGPDAPIAPAAPVSSGDWRLQVSADSWVEVLGHDGERLEYGLLHAGDERSYPAGTVAGFAIGNASGVTLQRDGAEVDLAPFQRANVARFTVSSDGRLHPGNG